jgi:uncharacterized protein DUF4953
MNQLYRSQAARVVAVTVTIAITLAAAVGACATGAVTSIPPDALLHDDGFVAIAKADGGAQARADIVELGRGDDFYLAINKKELGKQWFLSAFLTQYFPDQVNLGAARSLGTRVVSFQVQNGKLFVFDVDKNHQSSDLFDPTVLVEAYPVVTDYTPFQALDNAAQYVLFDPAAGQNRFALAADTYSDPFLTVNGGGEPFQIGLSFMQRFRKLADGASFEQVFTGSGSYTDGSGARLSYRASGTLAIALRRYAEGAHYQQTPLTQVEHFFRSDYHLVPGTGGASQVAIHWDIYAGMKPIHWTITPTINQVAQQFPDVHVIDAVKAGVENWNRVFGFTAFTVDVADSNDVMGQDDQNVIIFDTADDVGYAFANWRVNPNTGEIRGASVFLNKIWLETTFQDDPAASGPGSLVDPAPRPSIPSLAWQGVRTDPLCVMWAPRYLTPSQRGVGVAAPAGPSALTANQKLEAFLTDVVVHEVGHTLGLRHNFKGSLVPPSSSVMDYLTNEDSALVAAPGAYDVAAIKYLYGLSAQPPQDAFCTDEDVVVDPDCQPFDHGADPLNEYYLPYYQQVVAFASQRGSWALKYADINEVLSYVRAGPDPQTALGAFTAALSIGAVPAAASVASDPNAAATADALAALVLARLYLDPLPARGNISNPPSDAAVNAAALVQLQGNLVDQDGIRSFNTRRTMVDILKRFQTTEALTALRDSRAQIASARASMTGDQAALTDDLLARIDQAMNPYFVQ